VSGSPAKTTIRGATLAHQTSGEGSDLIWGHGLSSSRASEDLTAKATSPMIDWAKVPARVTRYDARGHGESDSTEDLAGYSWSALADDQLGLASSLGIDRYVVGGASMGAGTALHVAVTAPERAERLVLAIPPTAWETRAGQVDQWEATAHVIDTRGVEPVIAAGADLPPPDPFVDEVGRLERRAEAMRAWDPLRLARVFRGAANADFPSRDAVAAIDTPTLILAWTGDPVHPIDTAEQLHELIPDTHLAVASTPADLATWTDLVADFVR
jgi:pimeloyl-ACP methyl ester carboxylesterase